MLYFCEPCAAQGETTYFQYEEFLMEHIEVHHDENGNE